VQPLEGCPKPGGATFPSSARIKKRADFLRIQGGGRKLHSRNLLLISLPSSGVDNRLGITVTTKVTKSSPQRNLIRRRIREIFRVRRRLIAGPIDLVVIVRPGALALSFRQLEMEFVGSLQRDRLLP
jgi:ribonuclease P protein component